MKRSCCLVLILFLLVPDCFAGSVKKRCVSPQQASSYLESTAQIRTVRRGNSKVRSDNEMLVVEADADLLILSNQFDLRNQTLSFLPAPKGRYGYTKQITSFENRATQVVPLGDDDSRELKFSYFNFPFGKDTFDRCYINSNGNITFRGPDVEPLTADSLVKAPRISALFADLNPENAGTVLVQQTSEKVTISWLKVPEFYNQNQFDYGANTFQILLFPDGRIQIAYTNEISATQGLVGVISKPEQDFIRHVDFTGGKAPLYFSMVESFTDYESIDIPLLMKTIYSGHSDKYDFVTLLSNFDLTPIPGAQAFAINVRNSTRGIGNPSGTNQSIFKDNAKYGSSGRLQNITFLGNIHQYPSDPARRMTDLNVSLLELLAHEVGHRWLAYIKIGRNGNRSDHLLGRNNSHWSFFLDSEGSYLEGNQIQSQGSSSFVTGTPFQRYSNLDLYLMGFLPPEQVSGTFYVDDASGFDPDYEFIAESLPEASVKFQGSPRKITIDDIIQSNGKRDPKYSSSQKQFRHLFVLVAKKEQLPTQEELDYSNLLRRGWESFFKTATNNQASVITKIE